MPLTGPVAGVYSNTSQVTGPTLGATIATVTVGQGAYATAFGGYLSGSGFLPADADNMALQSDPTTQGVFVTAQVLLLPPALNVPVVIYHLPIYAISVIKLIAIGAGTGTVIYHASLAVSYPGPVGHLI